MATDNIFLSVNPLLKRPLVEKAMGHSRTTIYRKIQKGLMTRGVALGGNRVGWPANEVEAINKARIAGKSDDDIKKLVEELHKARISDQ
jgi:prophage regulatory protein